MCRLFGHFRCERRAPSWRGSYNEHNYTNDRCQKWSLTGIWLCLHRDPSRASTATNNGISWQIELDPAPSACFGLNALAYVCRWSSISTYCSLSVLMPKREKKGLERERESELGKGRKELGWAGEGKRQALLEWFTGNHGGTRRGSIGRETREGEGSSSLSCSNWASAAELMCF